MQIKLSAASAPLGVLLVACLAFGPQGAASKPKKKPEPAPPVVEAPPPPPPVRLSARVIGEAAAYRGYMLRANAITPAFTDGPSVAHTLRVGAAYEPQQFLRGAVAYGAVVAMQDQAFMAAVRVFAQDPTQRRAVAAQLIADPAYAAVFKGADSAAGLVVSALGNDGLTLFTAGKAVKQSAYDVQHAAWSKADVAARPSRLADTKALSATPLEPEPAENTRFMAAANGGQPLGLIAPPVAPPYTPVVLRSLAIAALAALGEGGDENTDLIMAMMVDPSSGSCLNMAKLNLYQCLAVAKPHYEDIFCIGQHIMMDTGQCLLKASGAPLPAELLPKPPAPPPVKAPPVVKTKSPPPKPPGKGSGKSGGGGGKTGKR